MRSLEGSDPEVGFPDPSEALSEPNGLLAMGGCLSVPRLLNAYRSGIFPWFNPGEPILWWSPDPRWVMQPAGIRISRSLGKVIRKNHFTCSFDRAFDQVIKACSAPRSMAEGTWISACMMAAYERLHQKGYAHSFEAWQGNELAGGLYGVAVGRVFFGESMFHRSTDASKVAFAYACSMLARWDYQLIDCQVHTRHLESLGAFSIDRATFCRLIRMLVDESPDVGAWRQEGGWPR